MQEEKESGSKDVFTRLIQYIKDIQFGSVTVIIQDGKIVQIEKTKRSGSDDFILLGR